MALNGKQDYIQYMLQLLDPLRPLYSPGGARLPLGDTAFSYSQTGAEMEAMTRPLWALAPFWASGGQDSAFADLYRRGLAAGCDPASPEHWGDCADHDQRFVEMAPIAVSLLMAPQVLWEPLSGFERQSIATWLDSINHHEFADNNWHFFLVFVNTALRQLGMPYNQQALDASFASIESFYLGDGWYRDGRGAMDFYIAFAFHYYSLIYAGLMEKDDPGRCRQYKQRALRFAQDYILWFDQGGQAIPYGRSLIYRFAQGAFWSACLFAGVEPFPLPVIKGLIARHLGYWQRQKITDRDGVLTLGYAYPNYAIAEFYSAAGSPYWALKTFLLLALPDAHPFWAADAAPLPPLPAKALLPHPGILLTRQNGGATLYGGAGYDPPGQGTAADKYAKFAYSSRFGMSVSRSDRHLSMAAPDSMLAFVQPGYSTVYVRQNCRDATATQDAVTHEWSPLPGVTVHTVIIPTDGGHRREHTVISQQPLIAYDCGFAVNKAPPGYRETVRDDQAVAENNQCRCAVEGEGPGATPMLVHPAPGSHLLFPNTQIPAVCYQISPGTTRLVTHVMSESWE